MKARNEELRAAQERVSELSSELKSAVERIRVLESDAAARRAAAATAASIQEVEEQHRQSLEVKDNELRAGT